jgi:hypothetical protein
MTKTYMIHAWCLRPFITTIDVEADTPEQAIARARQRHGELLDAAEECSSGYPWDEFAVYDDAGDELRYELDEPGCLRLAAPQLREALAWLATAAEDIDAAIDAVTDEFNTEREELQSACSNARVALAKSTRGQPSNERTPA